MANTLIFVDFPTPDPVATQRFYEQLFGWTIEGRPTGDFHRIVPGEGLHLGLYSEESQTPSPKPASLSHRNLGTVQPRTYILTDDAASHYLERAVSLGATALWEEEYWEEFDGYHASFLDPWGNQIVLWWKPGFEGDEAERVREERPLD